MNALQGAYARAREADGSGAQGDSATVSSGRFMLADFSEHACRVSGFTATQACLHTDVEAGIGTRVIAYFDNIGRIEGVLAEKTPDGYVLRFDISEQRREKIAARLRWLREGGERGIDQRRHPRFKPRDGKSALKMPDGREYPCEVLDISVSGASVRTQVLPAIGSLVMLGRMKGRVVRYHAEGIGIEFLRQMDDDMLRRSVRLGDE
ncbi:MAG TPA: PilZ domain-containing protein [Thermopetrobacter sp.]|nr:PilZ domain-containing protein [Thermopetrobacter sp.]